MASTQVDTAKQGKGDRWNIQLSNDHEVRARIVNGRCLIERTDIDNPFVDVRVPDGDRQAVEEFLRNKTIDR